VETVPGKGLTEHVALDEPQDDGLFEGKGEDEQEAGAVVFGVDADAQRGRGIANDGLGDTEDAEGVVGERILGDADGGADEGGADGLTAGDGVVDGDQQGQVNEVEAAEVERKQRLQAEGEQRNDDVDDEGEGF